MSEERIEIAENGPYGVTGAALLRMRKVLSDAGEPIDWERRGPIDADAEYWLCRCGGSSDKPFCDGTHAENGFDGTETAERGPTAERRKEYAGETIVLTDDESLCEHAAFCVAGESSAWKLTRRGDSEEERERVLHMVACCPSGRLEARDPGGEEPIEPDLPTEIAVVDHGPLWVRGGIPVVAADGHEYEVRNRVTLCRCGASKNKPFCDGSHADVEFRDA
ncbi:MAG: CDGSH iron-sulfur domain-containing protein [Gemmatimonadota bacterium]|nr:CDGSH iron-sulfur domain-containing protein [Gemmatimonadota bacterium]